MAGERILTLRKDGRWCKRIGGRIHYFGRGSYESALERYHKIKGDLEAGRQPRPDHQHVTIRQVVNLFLHDQRRRMDRGKLSPRTWAEYRRAGDMLVDVATPTRQADDLHQGDFAAMLERIEETCGDHARARHIRSTKTLIRWAQESGYITKLVRYGPNFKPDLTQDEGKHQTFTDEQCRAMVRCARGQLRAMVLLGLNCGYGQTDCAELRRRHMDLSTGVIDFPRPKTKVRRRAVLWPVTVHALRQAMRHRPDPIDGDDADRVFLTRLGKPWVRTVVTTDDANKVEKVVTVDALGQEFAKLMERTGVQVREVPTRTLKRKGPNGKAGDVVRDTRRKGRILEGHGLGFYTLRHTFRTSADPCRDQHAIARVMGHRLPSMADVYVGSIERERLQAVVGQVHRWLFGRDARDQT